MDKKKKGDCAPPKRKNTPKEETDKRDSMHEKKAKGRTVEERKVMGTVQKGGRNPLVSVHTFKA